MSNLPLKSSKIIAVIKILRHKFQSKKVMQYWSESKKKSYPRHSLHLLLTILFGVYLLNRHMLNTLVEATTCYNLLKKNYYLFSQNFFQDLFFNLDTIGPISRLVYIWTERDLILLRYLARCKCVHVLVIRCRNLTQRDGAT